MQNDVFNPVADTVNKQSELLLKKQNCFTVIDESIPSPREIQSEDTIVLPEIVSIVERSGAAITNMKVIRSARPRM